MPKETNDAAVRKPRSNTSKKSDTQQLRPYTKIAKAAKTQPAKSAAAQSTRAHRPHVKKPAQKNQQAPSVFRTPVKISFLGGLNEVGKNMTLYEYDNEMFIVDCGISFPDPEMLGVDLVLPDFTYVERNASKIKAIVITHGHEDHIGGVAYLLMKVKIPVYGTKLTIGLIKGKLEEHNIKNAELHEIKPGDHIKLSKFDIEAIHVNHSIPDALAFAIKCEAGTIIQTGDFKIDTTPIDGQMIDIARLSELGKQGVLCLLSDSTNAERPGYSDSEKIVGESFEKLFRNAGNRRIIVATFASNIHRVQQIINVAHSQGRKVALSGRSLENVVSIGSELGYLNVPDGVLIPLDLINKYPAEKMVLITTGSQGEPMSALTRMAFSDHRKVTINPNDYVIISARPIPGNEKMVGKVINELMKLGAEVVYEQMYDVHVSGHASQEELKLMLGITHPQFFIPVHGEQKHMEHHAQLAVKMGIPKDNIVIADNGRTVEVCKDYIKIAGTVPAGAVLVDGYGIGDVGSIVMKDRKRLAQDGLIIIVMTMQSGSGTLVSGPDVVSRGFVYVREAEGLIEELRRVATDTVYDCMDNDIKDWSNIKSKVRDDVSKFIYDRTKRSPMILPIIMEV
jgi:ribonuclease J